MNKELVNEALANAYKPRQTQWTDSIAVGSVDFVKTIKSDLGALAQGRKILEHDDSYQLKEELGTYIAHFEGKNGNIRGGGKRLYLGCKCLNFKHLAWPAPHSHSRFPFGNVGYNCRL